MTNTEKARLAINDSSLMANFMNKAQRWALWEGLKGEESDYFAKLILDMGVRISMMPATYQTEGDHVAYLHYFTGSYDAWITEKDIGDGSDDLRQHQAFGLCSFNGPQDGELGYVSLVEAMQHGAELDLHWTPKSLEEIRCRK